MASVSRYLRQNVLGVVAIFIALNGVAYAAVTTNSDLATGSVDSRVLASGAVEGPDIHSAAVGPKKMKLDKLVKWLQTRVSGACPQGESVQAITADGSVSCGADATAPTGPAGGDLAGTYPDPALADGSIDSASLFSGALQDGAAGTPTLRSLGTGASQAAPGNDPRLSDTRIPTNGSVTTAKFASLPHGKIRQTSCQTLASGTFAAVQFDQLQFGSGVTFDNATDSLTINTSGTYEVVGSANWALNATGTRAIEAFVNGAVSAGYDGREAASAVNTGQATTQLMKLSAGDVLTLTAGHTVGSPHGFVDINGAGCAALSVQWIGP